MVYGCGTLGLLSVLILRALHPQVRILAVARFAHQARLAKQLGAHVVIAHRPLPGVLEEVASQTGADLQVPWRGLPMLNGGVDCLYDSVASAETLEVGVRVVRSRGKIVLTGVEPPRRFEWTPMYFKEISLIGSNAFGVEEYDGRKQHAIEWYFEFLRTKALDVGPLVTHRFPLERYADAFMVCFDQGASSAVKVLFEFPEAAPVSVRDGLPKLVRIPGLASAAG